MMHSYYPQGGLFKTEHVVIRLSQSEMNKCRANQRLDLGV